MDAAFMYDAVRVYAQAADKVLRSGGGDLRNGTDVVHALIADGGSVYRSDLMGGIDVHIDSRGDSEGNYILLAMVDEPHLCNLTNTSFLRVGSFRYDNDEHWPVSAPSLGRGGAWRVSSCCNLLPFFFGTP